MLRALVAPDVEGYLCVLLLNHLRPPWATDAIDALLGVDQPSALVRPADVAVAGLRASLGIAQLNPAALQAALRRELNRQPLPPAPRAHDDERLMLGIAAGVGEFPELRRELETAFESVRGRSPRWDVVFLWSAALAASSPITPDRAATVLADQTGQSLSFNDAVALLWLARGMSGSAKQLSGDEIHDSSGAASRALVEVLARTPPRGIDPLTAAMIVSSPRIVAGGTDAARVLDVHTGRSIGPILPDSRAVTPPKVDVAIITMKEEEFSAVLEHFAPGAALHRRGARRDYEVACIDTPDGPCCVAITRCIGQGTGQAQAAATDVLQDIDPAYVVVVGIAGGIPTADFTLGDVIVSSFIHDLTLEDTGTGTPRFNATGGPLHAEAARVVARLPALASTMGRWAEAVTAPRPLYDGSHTTENQSWNAELDAAFRHHRANGRTSPIARAERVGSSDRLVKDPEIVAAWRTVIKGIVAIEMEIAGAYGACHPRQVPCFTIRGISDIIGWRRDEAWTLYACGTAAAYARALVGTGVLRQVSSGAENYGKLHEVP